MKYLENYKLFKQPNGWSCGPSCIKMVSDYVNKENSDINDLIKIGGIDSTFGATQERMEKILKNKKLNYELFKTLNIEEIKNGLNNNYIYIILVFLEEIPHWILITKYVNGLFEVNDPWLGLTKLTDEELIEYYRTKKVTKYSIGTSLLVKNRIIKIKSM